MYEAWDKIVKVLAMAGGAIAGLFGGFDTMLMVLMTCMVPCLIVCMVMLLVLYWDLSHPGLGNINLWP